GTCAGSSCASRSITPVRTFSGEVESCCIGRRRSSHEFLIPRRYTRRSDDVGRRRVDRDRSVDRDRDGSPIPGGPPETRLTVRRSFCCSVDRGVIASSTERRPPREPATPDTLQV